MKNTYFFNVYMKNRFMELFVKWKTLSPWFPNNLKTTCVNKNYYSNQL